MQSNNIQYTIQSQWQMTTVQYNYGQTKVMVKLLAPCLLENSGNN